jgi:ribosomal protein S14
MLHTKVKDLKFRKKYARFEKKHLVNTFLFKNIMSTVQHKQIDSASKKQILFKCLQKKRLRIKSRNVRRCVYTNRSRGVLQSFKLSRSLLRELMGFGIIPGCKKVTW